MMSSLRLSQIASITNGELVGPDAEIVSVSTDSRVISPNQLFIALKGPNFDGHVYINEVKNKGATGVIVEKVVECDGIGQVVVQDSLKALGKLGAFNRENFSGPVIGITGSCGKTTVKEMVAAILSQSGSVLFTKGNLNNHIGVPLTLLNIDDSYKYAVVEMGASGLGEIAYTCGLASPEIVLITNAGDAHLEGFGGYQNIVKAKGEIIDGVRESGTVILNRDDPAYDAWSKRAAGRKQLNFSVAGNLEADVVLIDRVQQGDSINLGMQLSGMVATVTLNVLGDHNVANALAAAAACLAAGVGVDQIVAGLESFSAVSGRLVKRETAQAWLIDDSYNANPQSVKAGLSTLAGIPGVKIAVLGEMAELGDDSERLHQEVGRFASEVGIDYLLSVGAHAAAVVQGAAGNSALVAKSFQDKGTLIEGLRMIVDGVAEQKPTVYVKGSRSAKMEEVIQAMTDWRVEASC